MAKLFPYQGFPQLNIYTDSRPFGVEVAGSDTYYRRWRNIATTQTIERIKKVSNEWQYAYAQGTWANRATLTYVDWLTYANSGDWED